MHINYYIFLEIVIMDIVFLLMINRFLKTNKLEKKLSKVRRKPFKYVNSKSSLKFASKVYGVLEKRFDEDKLAFDQESKFRNYIVIQYIIPGLLIIFILAKLKLESFPLILVPILYYGSNRLKYKKIKRKRHLNFQKNTYKIYKFIYNQVSSGIRPHECIISLYDVIEDRYFKKTLISMSAIYSQTSNIDLSLDKIKKAYPGIDAIMLCGSIKEGINVGNNIETIERQERLAFNKYFVYIKNETENIRFRGLLCISLFGFIIILLISIPLLYEMREATSKIFIN